MEQAQKEDKVLYAIIFSLAAFIVLSVYDVLYYFSMQQPAPFTISGIGWLLISWALRFVALIGGGILITRVAAPGKTGLFLILMGIALVYAFASSLLSNMMYAGRIRESVTAAMTQFESQLKAGGSSLTPERFFQIALVVSVVFKLIGCAIAALISYFVCTAVAGAGAKKAQAARGAGASGGAAGALPGAGSDTGQPGEPQK